MKKRVVGIVSTVILVIVLAIAMVGCKPPKQVDVGLNPFEVPEVKIGKTMPTVTPSNPIKKSMSASEMFFAAVDNYYQADYAIMTQAGTVDTVIFGGLKVVQLVDSQKIRDGKNGAAGVKYYVDNKSFSSVVKLWEENIVNADGTTKIRNGEKGSIKYKKTDGSWSCGKYGQPETFNTVNELVTAKKNDPRKIWMYDTAKDGVKASNEPIYDEKTKTYRFSIEWDLAKTTVNYKAVMEYMLEQGVGGAQGLEFKGLKFDVVVWENGFLRSVNISEGYFMSVMSIIDSNIILNSKQEYSYDVNEPNYGRESFNKLTTRF